MVTILFVILVVVGFLFMLLDAAGAWPKARLIAFGLWFAASIIWAITQLGGAHTGT